MVPTLPTSLFCNIWNITTALEPLFGQRVQRAIVR
jgi:hypothetical protein